MESLLNMDQAAGKLSGTTISFLGPAYNAAAADQILSYLQDRASWANPEDGIITLQNHANDTVGRLIGRNPVTGGTTPEGSSGLWQGIRVLLGVPNTPHNCYALAPAGCGELWADSPGKRSWPVPINQIDRSTPEKVIDWLETFRGSVLHPTPSSGP